MVYLYRCVNKKLMNCTNNDFHDHDIRHLAELYVPYWRLDIRKFSIIIHAGNVWNSIPDQIKKDAQSVHVLKQNFGNYLI